MPQKDQSRPRGALHACGINFGPTIGGTRTKRLREHTVPHRAFLHGQNISRGIASDETPDENGIVNSTCNPQQILVIMPNWLGDAVMATPFLCALRQLFPAARISCLGKALVQPVLTGLPIIDAAMSYAIHKTGRINYSQTAADLRKQKFDLAVILPNSFRSAFLAWRAGVPRRLGYNRDGRRLLLTDYINPAPRTEYEVRLMIQRRAAQESIAADRWPRGTTVLNDPQKIPSWYVKVSSWNTFQPLPTLDYYLDLSRYLGSAQRDSRMTLGITEGEREQAYSALTQAGISGDAPFMMLFPGAHFGLAKCWPPERFAAVAAEVAQGRIRPPAHVLIGGAAGEKSLIDAILQGVPPALAARVIPLYQLNNGAGVSLGAIKELVRRAAVVLCNDTGPRHFAAALDTPLVTLFGPTDPRWAEIGYKKEQQIALPVPCGPCQLKICPIDHRCMTGITAEMVLRAVDAQWRQEAV